MTKEEKDLLLKDLCARLPYGVKLHCHSNAMVCIGPYTLDTIVLDRIFNEDTEYVPFDEVKPYLFPLSSMTEEQREEFLNIQAEERKILFDALIEYRYGKRDKKPVIAPYKQIEWLNRNNFDYRGLIPMGLANDATGKNIY